MAITRRGMVETLRKDLDIPREECSRIVKSFCDLISSELEKSNTVMISGFGKWTVKSKRERKGRNPLTGEEMTIEARKVVRFKTSPNLSKAMNP